MSYFTTVRVVDTSGRGTKAEIVCGGTFRGFTDAQTGELSFDLNTNDTYNISVKRMGNVVSGTIRGGQSQTFRV